MAPKRKSDIVDAADIDLTVDEAETQNEDGAASAAANAPATKRARVSEAGEVSSSSLSTMKKTAPKDWREVVLEGEEEGEVAIYDDCNEVRRKIRLLQKQPNFKITHWLKEIGNINNNSFQRFMRLTGPTSGASNGTYYAAYVYFEKVRIAEGKKKTAKRERNEMEYCDGMSRNPPRSVLVFMPRY